MVTNPNIATIGLGGDPVPREGQRVIGPFSYDFSVQQVYQANLRAQMENLALISFAMAVYVDSGANPNSVTLNFAGQMITVKGQTQGWYPIISQRPIQYTLSCTTNAGVTNLFFANFHVPGFQWLTTASGVTGQTPWIQNVDAAGFSLSNVPSVTGNGALNLASGGAAAVRISGGLRVPTGRIDNTGGTGYVFPDGTVQVTAAVGVGGQTPWLQNVDAAGFTLSNIPTITGSGALTLNPGGAGAIVAGGLFQAAAAGIKFSDGTIQTSAAGLTGQTPWLQNIDAAGFSLSNIPTITGSGNIIVAAGGAGAVTLQTSSKPRFMISAQGAAVINQPDAGGGAGLTCTGAAQTAAQFACPSNPRIQLLDNSAPNGSLWLAVATGAGSYLTGSNAGDALLYNGLTTAGLQFGTNGAARLSIAANGNVGIQTTSPAYPLDVNGTMRLGGPSNLPTLYFADNTQANKWHINWSNADGLDFVETGIAVRVTFKPGGNVGIGTSAPLCPLDVAAVSGVPSIRAQGTAETGLNSGAAPGGVSCNIYNNGSAWVYRAAGAGALLLANASQAILYGAAAGPAGGTATLVSLLASYASAAAALLALPTAIALPAPGNATLEGGIPNSGAMMALTSNTSLTFRVRGTDGVIRQASLTLA
jgi:hypothetical protein